MKIALSTLVAALLMSQPLTAQNENLQVNQGEDLFTRAENLYNAALAEKVATKKSSLRKVIPQLTSYIKKFPTHKHTPTAKFYLGYALSQTGRLAEARKIFRGLIVLYKKGTSVVNAARYMAYDAGFAKNYKNAAHYYSIVAAQTTDKKEAIEASFRQAQCYQALKNNKSATPVFQAIIKNSDVSNIFFQKSHLRLGQIYNNTEKYAEALSHYTAIAVKGVDPFIRAEATFYKALCLMQTKKTKEAMIAYNEVLAQPGEKWKPDAVIGLMAAKYAAGSFKEVIQTAATPGVKLEGELAGKKDILAGQSYLKLKQYREAIRAFSSVSTRYKGTFQAYEADYRKILCYYNLKSKLVVQQVNTFINAYGGKYSGHKFMHTALMLQGETLFEAKNFAAAINAYKQINLGLIAPANKSSVLYKTAWCFYETKQYKNAVSRFSAFLKAFPKDPRRANILNIKARCHLALENNDSALKDYNEIIKLVPKTQLAGTALQASARILKEQKKYGEMVLRYTSLINDIEDLEPVSILNAHYWAAWGNFKTKNYKEALPHIDKANTIDKGAYKKQLSLLSVLVNYQLKDKKECAEAAKAANKVGIANDIPMSIYRWLGVQCYKSEEYADAETFLSLGVTNLSPKDTPVLYWRILGKSQYYKKNYANATKSIFFAIVHDPEKDLGHKVNMELYMALCQQGLNKPELAKATTIATLKQNPTGKTKAMLLQLLGDIYFNEQNYQQAAISFSNITEFYEDEEILPYAIAKVVKSLDLSNKPDDAELYRKKLKKQFPNYNLKK